ncbi:MAG: DUF2284 domain-containing protein [Oscillospiraceae bacterium]|nr:DUF2284 domain-containing protein [Oscillospiraceae bacterium]
MSNYTETLTALAKSLGADNCGSTDVEKVSFRREFRDACAANLCGKYGTCWMCPPDVGDIDEMISRAKKYSHVFVFQTIGQLEDSFDIEGMGEAGVRHNKIVEAIAGEARKILTGPLVLGAGACHICERCTKPDDMPCRFPARALPSLESYGIAVSELAAVCGLKYINGTNTVTYFGGILYA